MHEPHLNIADVNVLKQMRGKKLKTYQILTLLLSVFCLLVIIF